MEKLRKFTLFLYLMGFVLLIMSYYSSPPNTPMLELLPDYPMEAAFFILAIVGFSMCALGISRGIEARGFLKPLNIVGIVLGVLALPLFFFAVFGIKIPLFNFGYRTAFIILATLIFSKWVLARLGNLIK